MVIAPVTEEKIKSWRALYDRFADSLRPNRKTGEEVDDYFRSKYTYNILQSARMERVVQQNILENECFREKLLPGAEPEVRCYSVDGVMVGIDTVTGYFHVESEDVEKMVWIYDDLFVYRGLDAADLKNFLLVGQYLELTQK